MTRNGNRTGAALWMLGALAFMPVVSLAEGDPIPPLLGQCSGHARLSHLVKIDAPPDQESGVAYDGYRHDYGSFIRTPDYDEKNPKGEVVWWHYEMHGFIQDGDCYSKPWVVGGP